MIPDNVTKGAQLVIEHSTESEFRDPRQTTEAEILLMSNPAYDIYSVFK